MKLELIYQKIAKTKETILHYQSRLQELEKQKVKQESQEILQAVHQITTSPEEVRLLLKQLEESWANGTVQTITNTTTKTEEKGKEYSEYDAQ